MIHDAHGKVARVDDRLRDVATGSRRTAQLRDHSRSRGYCQDSEHRDDYLAGRGKVAAETYAVDGVGIGCGITDEHCAAEHDAGDSSPGE